MSEKLKKGLWAKNALIFRILTERSLVSIMNMLSSVWYETSIFLFVLIFSNTGQRQRAWSTVLNQNTLKGVQKVMI